ncbi:hypothetical protein B0O99DRAFT_646619 [Bisporella sp. PMI_857]|nr:hypothetical protein B0O99DRAFT_646619 [Bisporella sp. PMI_857]
MSDSKVEDTKIEEAKADAAAVGEKAEENIESVDATEDLKMSEETEKKSKTSGPRKYEDGVLKTSAQEDTNPKANSKYDPSILPESNDASQIRGQVAFYFGNSNLPDDKYLWNLTDGPENVPVDLDIILNFKRMKRFKDRSVVVAALKESTFLNVTGSEGEEKVNRKVAYNPEAGQGSRERDNRSIYAKGFGDEEKGSQFDIEAFFVPYGPIESVRLRRTDNKLFKGSVFVEFDSEDTAKAFLALEPKPLWKGEHTLKIMSKVEYQEAKNQEIRDGKIQPNDTRGRGRGRGRGGDRGRGRRDNRDRGDRDPDDWKKRREDDRANGFKDRRGGRNDKRGGRGGRGGRRDDRGPRNNDRNREREAKDSETKAEVTENSKPTEAPESNEKKRAREDDGGEEPAAKKIDTKTEVVAAS